MTPDPRPTASDRDREAARELALLSRSGVGGPGLREQVIANALASAREEGRAEGEALRRRVLDVAGAIARSPDARSEAEHLIRAAVGVR